MLHKLKHQNSICFLGRRWVHTTGDGLLTKRQTKVSKSWGKPPEGFIEVNGDGLQTVRNYRRHQQSAQLCGLAGHCAQQVLVRS